MAAIEVSNSVTNNMSYQITSEDCYFIQPGGRQSSQAYFKKLKRRYKPPYFELCDLSGKSFRDISLFIKSVVFSIIQDGRSKLNMAIF